MTTKKIKIKMNIIVGINKKARVVKATEEMSTDTDVCCVNRIGFEHINLKFGHKNSV